MDISDFKIEHVATSEDAEVDAADRFRAAVVEYNEAIRHLVVDMGLKPALSVQSPTNEDEVGKFIVLSITKTTKF